MISVWVHTTNRGTPRLVVSKPRGRRGFDVGWAASCCGLEEADCREEEEEEEEEADCWSSWE